MLLFAQFAFFIAALVAGYWFWLRPVLRSMPTFAEFYAETDSWLSACRERFAGIKGKLLAAGGVAASWIVVLHDVLIPYATGVDWTPVRQWLPDWAWPFIFLIVFWLIGRFRQMTDKRTGG